MLNMGLVSHQTKLTEVKQIKQDHHIKTSNLYASSSGEKGQ